MRVGHDENVVAENLCKILSICTKMEEQDFFVIL